MVGSDNKVEFRNVTAGTSYEGLRVITKGVKAGEKVVVDGLQKVKPGITVKTETQEQAKEKAKEKSSATPAPTGKKK